MKKIYFFFLFFSFWIARSQNQKLDNLKIELKNSTTIIDSLKIYHQLASLQLKSKQSAYIDSLYEYAQKHDNNDFLIKALKLKNKFYKYKYDDKKAIQFAKEMLRKAKDTLNVLKGLSLVGSTYHYFQNYDSALVYYNKGLNIINKNGLINDSTYYNISSILYGNIGLSYYTQNKLNKAIENFIKQSEFADKDNCLDTKMNALNYLAYSYLRLGQTKKTQKYFLKVIANKDKIKNKNYVYNAYEGLGINYGMAKDYEQSIKYITKALNLVKKLNDSRKIFDNYINLSIATLLKGDYYNSIRFSDSAINTAKKLQDKNLVNKAINIKLKTLLKLGKMKEVDKFINNLLSEPPAKNIYNLSSLYKTSYEFYKAQNQTQKALLYLEKWKNYSDSIIKKQRDSKIAEIETQYQTEKKDKEILQLKAQKAEKELALNQVRQEKILLRSGLGASVLFLGIFSFYYRRNQKQKKLIERLQRELHHRIKNNLATISALVNEIKKKHADNPELVQNLQDLNNRINSINEIHQQLYKEIDVSSLSMKKYVDKLSQIIQESFGNKNISIENLIEPEIKLQSDKSMLIGLLINEFITNSFKHAFTGHKTGKILIKLYKNGKNYVLSMSDNGKGLPENFNLDKVRTFGMDVMQLFAEQLNGKFSFDGKKGMNVEIIFPDN